MTINVGGREFEFRKPVIKHIRYLRSKGYEAWFASDAMAESIESDERLVEFSRRWQEFCRDAFAIDKDAPFPSEMEYGNLTPAEVGEIARSFFASLAGTPTGVVPPSPSSTDSATSTKSA